VLYDIYSKYHGKIKIEKLVPKLKPLWEEEVKKEGISRVRSHVRAVKMQVFDLFEGKFKARKNPIPEEFKSIMEISCRAPECGYPFNIDTQESGACYNCIYCFSITVKSSMYTSWFDGNVFKPRFPHKEYVRKTLTDILRARGVEPYQRESNVDRVKPSCGSLSDTKALKKAAAQGIPLRMGNRSECFLPPEKYHGTALEALKVIKEFNYPLIINTKSDLLLEEPYFSLITSLDKVAIQVSLIDIRDDVAKKLEPGAPPSSRRLEVIRRFREVGIEAYPRLEPIMGFINGTPQHLEAYAEKVAEAGARRCLMDTYSYTTRSDEIRKLFYERGFDFDRMFWLTSENRVIGSYLIAMAQYYLKRKGIKTATFDYDNIPYNDTVSCCCIDDFNGFGNFNFYNMFHFTRELIVTRKAMSFKDFDEKYYGYELHPGHRNYIRKVMNLEIPNAWCPIWQQAVEAIGRDEEGNIIYKFNPDLLSEPFENMVKMFGGGI